MGPYYKVNIYFYDSIYLPTLIIYLANYLNSEILYGIFLLSAIYNFLNPH